MDIGNILRGMGRYSEALEHFRQAQVNYTSKHEGPYKGVAFALRSIGNTKLELGQLEAAGVAYQQALSILKKILPQKHEDIADILAAQSQLAFQQDDVDNALTFGTEAKSIYRELLGDQHFKVARSYSRLGEIYMQQERLDEATEQFQKAQSIQAQLFGGKNVHLAKTFHFLALLKLQQNQYELALQYTAQALAALDYVARTDSDNIYSTPLIFDIINTKAKSLGQQYKKTSNPALLKSQYQCYHQGLELLDQFLLAQENDSRKFWLEKIFPLLEATISIAYSLYEQTGAMEYFEAALNYSEKNKSLLLKFHLQKEGALQFGVLLDSLRLEEAELKAQIIKYQEQVYSLQQSETSDSLYQYKQQQWTSKLFEQKKNYAALLKKMESSHPKYFALKYAKNELRLPELQQRAKREEEAFIEYFFGEEQLFIFTIWEDGFHWKRLVIEPAFLNELEVFQKALTDIEWIQANAEQAFSFFTQNGWQLYDKLLGESLQHIPKKLHQLCIIPDGKLCLLPFETLLNQKVSKETTSYKDLAYLIQSYNMRYDYSAQNLRETQSKGTLPYLGFAPSYTSTTRANATTRMSPASLLYNQEEVENGQAHFSGKHYTGSNATVQRFLENAPQASLLHLATHALVNDEQPLLSQFLFADSPDSGSTVLPLYQIYNLKLRARHAILSACNTGVGQHIRGEGIQSLARGFRYAGVPSMCVSIWPINGASTKDIISDYLKNLKAGSTKSEALRQAKLVYLGQADRASSRPYYWAGLVMVGDDEVVVEGAWGYRSWLLAIGLLGLFIFLIRSYLIKS